MNTPYKLLTSRRCIRNCATAGKVRRFIDYLKDIYNQPGYWGRGPR